jgi:hypothetical protein
MSSGTGKNNLLSVPVPDERLFLPVPDERLFLPVPDERLFLPVPDERYSYLYLMKGYCTGTLIVKRLESQIS